MIRRVFAMGLAIVLAVLSADPVFALNNGVTDEELTEAYIEFSERLHDMNISASVCLDDFMDGYSESLTMEEYIEGLIEYEIEVSNNRTAIVQENNLVGSKSVSRSILTKWYDNIGTSSPSLPRAASYSKYNIENVVKKGDVIYETEGLVAQVTGHIALVEGTFWDEKYKQFYIRTIEAGAGGVVYGVLEDTRYDERGVKVYKVTDADAYQKQYAINFCVAQLGKDYNITGTGNCSYSTSAIDWYCSELVWAAYYNQGINFNGTTIPENVYMPAELASSSELTRRTISLD